MTPVWCEMYLHWLYACVCVLTLQLGGAPSCDHALSSRWKHGVIHTDRFYVLIELNTWAEFKQHDVVHGCNVHIMEFFMHYSPLY